MKITKDMIIADVLMKNHSLGAVFVKHGLHCLGCAASNMETISDAAMVHNVNLDDLLDDLNKLVD